MQKIPFGSVLRLTSRLTFSRVRDGEEKHDDSKPERFHSGHIFEEELCSGFSWQLVS
jgi:hypothetical protein